MENPAHVNSEYLVILSITYSLRSSLKNKDLYDYVIIDEASQVDIVTGTLALSCAKNAAIVGDLKQLPNVVTEETAKFTKNIFDTYSLNDAYEYSTNSLLSSAIKVFEQVPRTLLREHYRCHPAIIGFCNQKFYNNELIVLTNDNKEKRPLKVYKTVEGNHASGRVNQRQVDVILNEIIPNENIDLEFDSVGIIAPYNKQVNEVQKQTESAR